MKAYAKCGQVSYALIEISAATFDIMIDESPIKDLCSMPAYFCQRGDNHVECWPHPKEGITVEYLE